MDMDLTFTTKEDSAIPVRIPMPMTPRKCYPHFSSLGAHAVSVLTSKNSLSDLYDRDLDATYLDQCFEVISCIGYGCFGVVFKVNSLEDGKLYAIKKSREKFHNAVDKKRRLVEVEQLEKLSKHPKIIQMHRAWEENGHLYLQLELCEISLAKYTMTHHKIPEEMIWNILTDMTMALKHLHDRDIMHLDIKLDNILISADGSYKLSDFGISVDCTQAHKEFTDGDSKYIAPEVLNDKFTKSADIFSLGISMYEVSFDVNLPHCGILWQNLRKGEIPHLRINTISKELYELIKWMMHPDPDSRPTADMILKHPHIKRIILKRRFSHFMDTLVTPGKLIMSFLTLFGKAGYDMVMGAFLKLQPFSQVCPALDADLQKTEGKNHKDSNKGSYGLVTSTPKTDVYPETSQSTPSSFNEIWSESECSLMDIHMLSPVDISPSAGFLSEKNTPSSSGNEYNKRKRVYPYSQIPKMNCDNYFKKRYSSTARNLLNDFSE